MEPIIEKGRPRLTDEQLAHFKEKLEQELKKVERELRTVAERNPDDPADWELHADDMDIMQADKNEAADKSEDMVDNAAILNQLEIRLNHIKRALKKTEEGTYGTCEVGGDRIPLKRLEANPAATTCIDHINKLHGD